MPGYSQVKVQFTHTLHSFLMTTLAATALCKVIHLQSLLTILFKHYKWHNELITCSTQHLSNTLYSEKKKNMIAYYFAIPIPLYSSTVWINPYK